MADEKKQHYPQLFRDVATIDAAAAAAHRNGRIATSLHHGCNVNGTLFGVQRPRPRIGCRVAVFHQEIVRFVCRRLIGIATDGIGRVAGFDSREKSHFFMCAAICVFYTTRNK